LQYRNFGTHETLVTNHTVNVDGRKRAGLRWYELRRPPTGAWSIFQQGTYSPDGTNRWMGSAALDAAGNMGIGYSASSASIFPSIRFAFRQASDPAGKMAGEVTLVAGQGSQTGSTRWGDYSSLKVDPVETCTFWYTNQYYANTSPGGWRTRIVAVRMPQCQ
jgi:hypothetical protein